MAVYNQGGPKEDVVDARFRPASNWLSIAFFAIPVCRLFSSATGLALANHANAGQPLMHIVVFASAPAPDAKVPSEQLLRGAKPPSMVAVLKAPVKRY